MVVPRIHVAITHSEPRPPGENSHMAKKKSAIRKSSDSAANLGFEAKLWLAADKMRNNMDAAESHGRFFNRHIRGAGYRYTRTDR